MKWAKLRRLTQASQRLLSVGKLLGGIPVLLISITAGCASSAQSSPTIQQISTVKLSSAPFAHCQSSNSQGNNYLNDVVEPSVAVSGSTIIGVWQQDRWSNGGAHAIAASASQDGGKTWHNSDLPFGRCVPGGLKYDRADDPWVSIGPDGTAYATGLVFDGTPGGHNSVGAAVSKDGGRTWQHAQIIDIRKGDSQYFDDKDTVTADPVHPGTAYAVWRREYPGNLSPLVFTKTVDGGIDWSTPRVIVPDGGQVVAAVGGQIAVDPKTGTLFNVFLDVLKSSSSQLVQPWIAASISHDGGASWSQPHLVFRIGELKHQTVIRTQVIPVIAYDPKHRSLDAVWNDPYFNHGRYFGIVFTRSVDGIHWSSPIRIDAALGKAAFDPMVAVTSNGIVSVTYYQLRHAASGKNQWLTDYWIRSSVDGGKVFKTPRNVAGPFDITNTPIVQGGYFVGDYEGLAAGNKSFALLFVQTSPKGAAAPTHVFAAMVNG